MNPRAVAVLVVLVLALGGGALLLREQAASQRPPASGTLGQPLLKGLKAAEIAAIVIREPKATLTLERKEARWIIVERGGFPADLEKVRQFVLKAIELKIGQAEPIGEADRARLQLDDKGTGVEFRGAGGKPLARLAVGRKYFKREPDNPETARADGRFVQLPGGEQTAYVVADPLPEASAKSADWIDRRSFQAEKLRALELRYPDGERWRLERAADNADWKLEGLRPGERLDITRANSATYSLGLLELADVAPKDATPADTGLDKPILVDATTLDGLSYAIRVGRLAGENYYVSFTPGGALVKERLPEKGEKPADRESRDKEFTERIKKLEARLPLERQLSQHVLLVPRSKLEDTLKKRAGLLEKRDEKK